jgi:hypothetical protein
MRIINILHVHTTVIPFPLFSIREDLVGLTDIFELGTSNGNLSLGFPSLLVRVELQGTFPISFADLVHICITRNPEDLIEVFPTDILDGEFGLRGNGEGEGEGEGVRREWGKMRSVRREG